jgi:hypothetical protein
VNPPPPSGEPRTRSRAPRRATHPAISVVLILDDDTAPLRSVAAPVIEECARAQAELVAVRRGPSAEMLTVARSYPFARCVGAPIDATREQLRVLGFNEASGDIVAFVEDPAEVTAGWIDALQWGREPAPADSPDSALPEARAERAAE